LILLAVAAGAAAGFPSGDPDVFFHLATGREIVESGRLPMTEPFCFPAEGRPFVNHEWLFDIALWSAFQPGGAAGVVFFKITLSALLFLLVGRVGQRMGGKPSVLLVTGLLFLPLFRYSLEARPHLAGYILAAASILALYGIEERRKVSFAFLALITIVWVNTHGSFPLAFALWGIWLARSLVGAGRTDGGLKWMAFGGLVLCLSFLVNPWGPWILETVIHHMEPAYRILVPEWKPLEWGDEPARDLLFLALIAASLLSFLLKKNRGRVAFLAILALFLAPAAMSTKFILGLAVGAIPILAANLSSLGDRTLRRVVMAGAAASTVSIIVLTPMLPPWQGPGLGFDLRDHPDEVMDFAAQQDIEGHLFNPFNHGGFCEFHSYPRLRTFIDGRAYVHGLEGISTYLGALSDYDRFRTLHRRYGFDVVLADILDPSFPRLLSGLSSDNNFSMVWLDSHFALFVPVDSLASRGHDLETYEILRPVTDPRFLFEVPDASLVRAHKEVERVLASSGGRTLGLLLKGVLGLREAGIGPSPAETFKTPVDSGACLAASEALEDLVLTRPDTPMFRYFLAASLVCAGRCEEAWSHANIAAPGFHDAVRLCDIIADGRCITASPGGTQ